MPVTKKFSVNGRLRRDDFEMFSFETVKCERDLRNSGPKPIDLSAILQKSLDRAFVLYNLISEVLLSRVRASIYHYCAHSKILQNAPKRRSLHILFLEWLKRLWGAWGAKAPSRPFLVNFALLSDFSVI